MKKVANYLEEKKMDKKEITGIGVLLCVFAVFLLGQAACSEDSDDSEADSSDTDTDSDTDSDADSDADSDTDTDSDTDSDADSDADSDTDTDSDTSSDEDSDSETDTGSEEEKCNIVKWNTAGRNLRIGKTIDNWSLEVLTDLDDDGVIDLESVEITMEEEFLCTGYQSLVVVIGADT
ncbi:MAG: hypothetical protein GY847_42140 [Proteobacteria bacterium]|nr:hypothetical protein [Pseudomonadota bacterium]